MGDAITIEWRAFLLRPEREQRPLEKFRSYTESWRRPASLEPRCEFRVWATDDAPPSHSVPAAVAAKVARRFGDGPAARYHDALLRAYFAENRTVSERAVLVDVAAAAGIDGPAFDAALTEHGDEAQREVFRDYHEAVELGIYAVPAVVVDGRFLVSGAVAVDDYERVVERAGEPED